MDNQISNVHAAALRPVPQNIANQQRTDNVSRSRDFGRVNRTIGPDPRILGLLIQIIQLLLNLLSAQKPPGPEPEPTEYRSINGAGNNQNNADWGAAHQWLNRALSADPAREPGGATEVNLPSAREVSNAVSAQQGSNSANSKGLSDMFWLWGQFLDHDVTLVEGTSGETADISVPTGDPHFDPNGTGTATIGFARSHAELDASGQKRYINDITAFIDGSNVYGSNQEIANTLRSFEGGRLRMSAEGLLPTDGDGQFLAGDVRANENVGLASMHTLWVREHNRIADQLAAQNPAWNDETLYQEARKKVVAEMQAITYNEFLPNLLGDGGLSPYRGYDAGQNPQLSTAFSSAAYRFGHTMLSSNLLRLDENGREIPAGNLSLRDAFFRPDKVAESGIEPILRGFASQTAQAVDPMVVDDVRNFLFGPPGAGGLDLAALNIQRGRDQGLPGYNDAREQLGLRRIESFNDPIWQDGVGEKLAQVYDSPDDVDLWVAGLAEEPVGDSLLGETSTTILAAQFEALRAGDRFWYENQYRGYELQELNQLGLSDIIKRNTNVENIQDNVMVASNVHQRGFGNAGNFSRSAAPAGFATPGTLNSDQGSGIPQEILNNQVIQELLQALRSGRLG